MIAARAGEELSFIPLVLPSGTELPVLLYAGGTTGLLLIDIVGKDVRQWSELAARAEEEHLSALVFGASITGQPQSAAAAAEQLLRRLGVERIVLAAAGRDSEPALRVAAQGSYDALVLVSPSLSEGNTLEDLLAKVRIPKLVLVGSGDKQAAAAGDRLYRGAIGRFALRHFPVARSGADLLAGACGERVMEAIVGFAIYTCGNGGAIASSSP